MSGADGDLYRSGDVVFADNGRQGYLGFVGRSDDVFKSSDYRISPFELESIVLEHEKVAEAAVVPGPIHPACHPPRPIPCGIGAKHRARDGAVDFFGTCTRVLRRSSASGGSIP